MNERKKRKIHLPGETINELITSVDDIGFGLARAEIQQSERHFHQKTTEVYVLISGELLIYRHGFVPIRLTQPGDSFTLKTGIRHQARRLSREPAIVLIISIPAH